MDNKLTILLTINRNPEYTFRWMAYNDKIRLPFKILIADGGQDKIVSDILMNNSNFPNLNYLYLHYKESGTHAEFFYRVNDALKHVDTPYVLKAANDDFFIVDGIRDALSFLNSHDDYISSRGEIYDFCVTGASKPRYDYIYGCITYFKQFNPEASNISIIKETALERLRVHYANPCSIWYEIYRTKDLKKYHRILYEVNPADGRFVTEIIDSLTAADGKVNRGRGLFILHQANSLMGEGARVLKQFPTYEAWMQVPTWQRDFNNFIQAVAETISARDNISVEEARNQFTRMFHDLYLTPRLSYKQWQRSDRLMLVEALKKPIKDIVQKLDCDNPVRKLFTAGIRFRHRRISDSVLKNSKYHKELMSIIEFLNED